MISTTVLWGVAAGAAAMVSASLLMMRQIQRQDRLAARLDGVRDRYAPTRASASAPSRPHHTLIGMVHGLGSALAGGGLLSATTKAGLQDTLAAAGLRGAASLNLFVGSKVLLMAGLPLLAYILLHGIVISSLLRVVVIAAAAIVGLIAPDFVLGRLRASYVKKVAAGLPDALDMMVICSEAGLGLERTIERVAEEIAGAHPQVGRELQLTLGDMGISADRREALKTMATRSGLDGVRRLAGTLIQSIQYGTPLSQALRTLAADMRQESLTLFEERAARLPVLLTLPMIMFILPCIFIVVGGPAAITVMKAMGGQ